MQRKKPREKNTPLLELEKAVTEVLIANGRSLEPFVKVFHYQGENIAQESLGALIGVFEIDEKSEDSAYIVNFLASIAKKEYFGNPRRGAIESFEATLHKVNLALAELVKHGNVSWLGKFHGSLCVLEKNHIHFSVTGKSNILLWRNDAFIDISDGLASEESHIHPIKTFVEISSGRLDLDDRIIAASPELLALFSLEELRKNALRMDKERFTQFLRTALVNELDMAGVVIVDFIAGKPVMKEAPSHRKPKSSSLSQDIYRNVFSETIFTKKPEQETPSEEHPVETELPHSEYIDKKTGHIYIQGDTPEEESSHPLWERTRWLLSDFSDAASAFLTNQRRFWRKNRKTSSLFLALFQERIGIGSRRLLRALRRQTRHWQERLAAARSKQEKQEEKPQEEPTEAPLPIEYPSAPEPKIPDESPAPETMPEASSETASSNRASIRTRLASFYAPKQEQEKNPAEALVTKVEGSLEKARTAWSALLEKCSPGNNRLLRNVRSSLLPRLASTVRELPKRYRDLSPKTRRNLLIGMAAVILLIGALFLSLPFLGKTTTENTTPEAASDSQAQAPSLSGEKNLRVITALSAIQESGEEIVSPIVLDKEVFLVTKKGILRKEDDTSYPIPTEDPIVLTAAMEDLRLIFLFTEHRELYSWSPLTRTYAKNSLALPEGAAIRSMGSYLTYLYFLDSTGKQIYRFPRATGGFGNPTQWLKDSVEIDDSSSMAIGSDIVLFASGTLKTYSRGRIGKAFESPLTPLKTTLLTSPEGSALLYALDRENGRVIAWNQDGALTAQYTSATFSQATGLTVSEDGSEIFIATPHTLYSFKPETL